MTRSTRGGPSTRTTARPTSFSLTPSPVAVTLTSYVTSPGASTTSRKVSVVVPCARCRVVRASGASPRDNSTVASASAVALTVAVNRNGSPTATRGGTARPVTATSSAPSSSRPTKRTSTGTPRAKRRRAGARASRPVARPSDSTSTRPERSAGINASAASRALARFDASASTTVVKPPKRCSAERGMSTRTSRPKERTPSRSPGRRPCSTSRTSSSALAWLPGGIDRERSTTNTTSLPALRSESSGRANSLMDGPPGERATGSARHRQAPAATATPASPPRSSPGSPTRWKAIARSSGRSPAPSASSQASTESLLAASAWVPAPPSCPLPFGDGQAAIARRRQRSRALTRAADCSAVQRSTCSGISDRHGPESLIAMRRNR